MNKNFKTISIWLAAAVFLFALAINVKVSLDDPFALLSDEAIATSSSNSSSSSSGLKFVKLELTNETIVTTFQGKWGIGEFEFETTSTTNVYDCESGSPNTCNTDNIGKKLPLD